MSGEGIGDAVPEGEGEEDVEQSAAEPTLQQSVAVATGAKSRVPGAPGQVGRPQLSKAVSSFLRRGRSPPRPTSG